MHSSTTPVAATDIDRLVDQLRRIHDGEAWHGPSVREALSEVSAADAMRRPISGAHTIWEIVEHIRVVEETVRRRITGEPDVTEPDWTTVSDPNPTAWKATLGKLATTERGVREAVAGLSPDRLAVPLPGREQPAWEEIVGLIQHDAYHAGQISLLRKAR